MIRPDNVKEYLYSLWNAHDMVDILARRSEVQRSSLFSSCSVCRAIGGGIRDGSVQEDKLLSLTDTNQRLKEAIEECQALEREAEQLISSLRDPRLRAILQDRYLARNSWESIADRMFICLRQVYRLHGKALELLREPYSLLLQKEREGLAS